MQTLSLGGTQVSCLCLGTMNFGTRNDRETSFALLDLYYEAGGRFLDTANNYAYWFEGGNGGESERMIGAWMRERGNRDDLFLASKVGFNTPPVGMSLHPDVIAREIGESLARLGTDRLDLYYAHTDPRDVPLATSMQAFHDAVRAGKARRLGCSNFRAWRILEANHIAAQLEQTPFLCIQTRYSYLKPNTDRIGRQLAANEDLLDFVRATPTIAMLAYSPLLGGAYTRMDRELPAAYQTDGNRTRLAVLKEVAIESGATVNQVVLAWMLQSDPPVIPLIAASRPADLQENLDAATLTLLPDQMQRLNEARS